MLTPVSVKHIERVLKHEGGYANHPRDPGGETNLGITWPALKRAQAKGIVEASRTIRTLTRDDARAIYYEDYYKPLEWIDNDALRFQVFDAAVNSGVSRAISWLQRVLGVEADGIAGPITQQIQRTYPPIRMTLSFIAMRQDFLNDLGTFDTFGKGWTQRMVDNLRYLAEDL